MVLKGNRMKKNDIVIKLATKENVDEIYSLMQEVYNKLEDKTLYVCDDLEYVKNHIQDKGFTVIACNDKSKIIGSFIFRFPMDSKDNLGRDIGLEKEKLGQVVHMESVVVLSQYRGNGLQQAMLKYGEELIDKAKYKYFMATVSPNNPGSYKSLEKCGYKMILAKEKYNGLERRIYLKEV